MKGKKQKKKKKKKKKKKREKKKKKKRKVTIKKERKKGREARMENCALARAKDERLSRNGEQVNKFIRLFKTFIFTPAVGLSRITRFMTYCAHKRSIFKGKNSREKVFGLVEPALLPVSRYLRLYRPSPLTPMPLPMLISVPCKVAGFALGSGGLEGQLIQMRRGEKSGHSYLLAAFGL
jgi:hypothetical protein